MTTTVSTDNTTNDETDISEYCVYLQMNTLYTFAIFAIGVGVRHAGNIVHIPVPYTVNVFLVGVVFGFLPVGAIADIGPYTIIVVFIPVLIFEGSFAIDVYTFKQIFLQVLVMAFPALVVMIGLTAVVSRFLFQVDSWDWRAAMLFGSILSATDPVAVVAIMKELGVKKQLSLLIEGESMLNDGTAMVFFNIFHEMLLHPKPLSIGDTILNLLMVSIGGPIVGYVMAKIAVFWLHWTFNDSITEISITLFTSYLTFYIAQEYLHVSGVLAVVTCGVIISDKRTCISPEVENFLHCFWETLSFIANTLIFALCGLIISKKVLYNANLTDFIILFILYFMLQVIRALTILLFSPILCRIGYGMSWQDGLIATWSGLRGGVGLALSLIVFLTVDDDSIKTRVLFHVSLIVVATLLINATTVSPLLNFLGMNRVSLESRQAMKKAINKLEEGKERCLIVWKVDRFLSNVNWDVVKKTCKIEDPYSGQETVEEIQRNRRVVCPKCQTVIPYVPSAKEIHQMKAEAVRKFLKLFKKAIWEQFEKGTLSGFGVRKLSEMVEQAFDSDMQTISITALNRIWKMPKWLETVQHIVSACIVWPARQQDNSNAGPAIRAFHHWSSHWLLHVFVYGMQIVLVLIVICLYFLNVQHIGVYKGIDNASAGLMGISAVFFIFRVLVFQWHYVKTPWFFIALASLALFMVDLLSKLILMDSWFWIPQRRNKIMTSYVDFMVLRIVYILPLLEMLNLLISHFITQKKLNKLRVFCDIARGYVFAHERVILDISSVSDNESIRTSIVSHADLAKIDIIRELGLVQGLYPNIALEVKTSQAIRSVLNVMRNAVYDLLEEGGIDEIEGALFIKVIESKMKRLLAAPPKLEGPSIYKILASVSWIDNETNLILFIKSRSIKLNFPAGRTIIKTGEHTSGIYVIVSGLVKVESTLMSEKVVTDFLATGNVVGEISSLTKRPRGATLTCETSVKALYLSMKNLERAMKQFSYLEPPLRVRLWRMTATRLAFNILSTKSSFKGYSKEMILRMLEEFQLVTVETNMIDLTGLKNVVLIAGKGVHDGKEYVAPCYIPSNVTHLTFPQKESPSPVLFYDFSFSVRRRSAAAPPSADFALADIMF